MYDNCWSCCDQLLIIGYDHWSCYIWSTVDHVWSMLIMLWSTVDHTLWSLIIAMKDCWSYMINIDRCIISWPLQHSITVVKFPFDQHQLFWSAKFTKIHLTVSLICTIYMSRVHTLSLDLIVPFGGQYVHIHLIGFYCSYWLAQVPTFFLIYCSSTATLPKSWHVRTSKLFLTFIIVEQH